MQLIEMDGGTIMSTCWWNIRPVAVSNLVNSLKGVSSRLLRRERPDIQKRYWKGVLWSLSYFSPHPVAVRFIVRQYIEQQQTPLKTQDGRYAVRAILPALNGGACRAPGQNRGDAHLRRQGCGCRGRDAQYPRRSESRSKGLRP